MYLNFEKLRFGDKLKYELSIDDLYIDELLIPQMVLHLYIENAIRHGLMPLPEGGNISIAIKC